MLHIYNVMGKNSSSLIMHIFNVSLKEKFIFVKLFKTYFSSDIMASILNLSVKALIILLFECKLLKFTFKAVCYINDAWILL